VSYHQIFLRAYKDGQLTIHLDSRNTARNLRAHLYAFRAAALQELPEAVADLILILPEIKTRIDGRALVIYVDPHSKELANAARRSSNDSNTGVPVED
jgi:hypothetical protein